MTDEAGIHTLAGAPGGVCIVLRPRDRLLWVPDALVSHGKVELGGLTHSELLPSSAADLKRRKVTGWQFNRNKFGLSFGSKNGLRFHFDSVVSLNYPFYNISLV